MPHINLLPWRDELRAQKQKEFGIMAGIAAAAMLAIIVVVHLQIAAMIDYQKSRNNRIAAEIKILNKKIKEIKDLESEKENLIARMKIVEQLQTSRPDVVHLFDELVTTLPEGVYLKTLSQKGKTVTLKGVAQSNARVSSFMRELSKSEWLKDPDLKLIKAEGEKGKKKTGQGLKSSNFQLSIKQTKPKSDIKKEDKS